MKESVEETRAWSCKHRKPIPQQVTFMKLSSVKRARPFARVPATLLEEVNTAVVVFCSSDAAPLAKALAAS